MLLCGDSVAVVDTKAMIRQRFQRLKAVLIESRSRREARDLTVSEYIHFESSGSSRPVSQRDT
jgi:hypothetical protein